MMIAFQTESLATPAAESLVVGESFSNPLASRQQLQRRGMFRDQENMNSYNHDAYGAIGQWMYERIAGLAPDPANPGYKHFFVRPIVGGPLTWVRAELETAYGKASSSWKKEGDTLVMDVMVPPNTTATIQFPNGRTPEMVSAGTYQFELKMK